MNTLMKLNSTPKLGSKFVGNLESMEYLLFNHFSQMEAVKIIRIGIGQPEVSGSAYFVCDR